MFAVAYHIRRSWERSSKYSGELVSDSPQISNLQARKIFLLIAIFYGIWSIYCILYTVYTVSNAYIVFLLRRINFIAENCKFTFLLAILVYILYVKMDYILQCTIYGLILTITYIDMDQSVRMKYCIFSEILGLQHCRTLYIITV